MRALLPRFLASLLLGLASGGGSIAAAQTPAPGPEISVGIGQALEKKIPDLGAREIKDLSADLRQAVERAVAHARGDRPVRVDLVIEDAVPNRPTIDQLGRTPGLSMHSVGLGGARVSGTATYADGAQRPIKVQFFETDLRDVMGFSTWYDADRAFDEVAYDIGKGRLPGAFTGPGPSGSGHFGYPFSSQP